MSRLHIATRGPWDWQSRLAEPEKQWKRHYSALEAAVAWENAQKTKSGLPAPIAALLAAHEVLSNPELLLGVVEHKVPLKYGSRASQNDVWALVKVQGGFLSLAVEAKAGEDFDRTVAEWLASSEPGSKKTDRLRFLIDTLCIKEAEASVLRYQLLHRAASALIEADRFSCQYAGVVIQSFENPERGTREQRERQIEDFNAFTRCLGADAKDGRLARANVATRVPLYVGWVTCKAATDEECAATLAHQ